LICVKNNTENLLGKTCSKSTKQLSRVEKPVQSQKNNVKGELTIERNIALFNRASKMYHRCFLVFSKSSLRSQDILISKFLMVNYLHEFLAQPVDIRMCKYLENGKSYLKKPKSICLHFQSSIKNNKTVTLSLIVRSSLKNRSEPSFADFGQIL